MILAHSFGAGIAAHLAHDLGPLARGLAVLAPAGLVPHSLLRYRRVVRAIGRAARTPGLGWTVGHMLVPPYRAVGFRHASAAEARRTFSVVGAWDYASTRHVASALGVRPLTFPTGGHTLQKTRASEIGGALCAWLDGLPPP